MKKWVIIAVALVTILVTSGISSAHWSFGLFLPPIVVAPPPPPVAVYPYYPSYSYYGPSYYGQRVWVPGYWVNRWSPYGWTRAWIPGYWRYMP